jgi:TolB-like protein/DNA-binding winged helix-turn-helix (wHTH) protein/tetratricopeptide (TPR) repeat protein
LTHNPFSRDLTGRDARDSDADAATDAGDPPMEPSTSSARGYRFGAFELDARSGELRRRGLKVRLRGRPVEILLVLLARPGELVTRDELRTALWGADTFVDFDHGLNSAMNKLRDALGDAAGQARYVETVPRRGYRFVAPVEILTDVTAPSSPATPAMPQSPLPATSLVEPAPLADAGLDADVPAPVAPAPSFPGLAVGQGRRTSRLVILAICAIGAVVAIGAFAWIRGSASRPANAAHRAMLVVLPFENLSGTAEQDFFTDGVTDETIAQLGGLDPRRLGVIARTTAMQYKHSSKGVMEIGRELDVDYLLEGSVRRDDEHVRITARLVDVKSQTQLWAETYEHELKDVLMFQHDVATRLAKSLAGGVLSPVLEPPAPALPKFAAYELVLRARSLRQQASEASAWRCVATFEESIGIDPSYAPAHAGLADCYRLLGAPGWEAGPPAELLDRARRAAERALALDPQLADAYAVRAMVRFNGDWDLDGAMRDIDHAIALNPSLARAHQYRSAVLTAMGKFTEAVDAARYAQQLDPLSVTESTTLGIRLYYAQRYPEAIEQFTRTIATTPEFAIAHWGLGETYRELGRQTEAIAELRQAVSISQDSAYMRAWLAHGLALAGERGEADAIRRDLERLANERYVSPFLFALIASGSHDRTETLAWLKRTATARSGWMPFVPIEPEFQWIRDDPAFVDLTATPATPKASQATPRGNGGS